MKYMKYVVFGSFLALISIFIAFQTKFAGNSFEIDLPARHFATMYGSMQNNDYLYLLEI